MVRRAAPRAAAAICCHTLTLAIASLPMRLRQAAVFIAGTVGALNAQPVTNVGAQKIAPASADVLLEDVIGGLSPTSFKRDMDIVQASCRPEQQCSARCGDALRPALAMCVDFLRAVKLKRDRDGGSGDGRSPSPFFDTAAEYPAGIIVERLAQYASSCPTETCCTSPGACSPCHVHGRPGSYELPMWVGNSVGMRAVWKTPVWDPSYAFSLPLGHSLGLGPCGMGPHANADHVGCKTQCAEFLQPLYHGCPALLNMTVPLTLELGTAVQKTCDPSHGPQFWTTGDSVTIEADPESHHREKFERHQLELCGPGYWATWKGKLQECAARFPLKFPDVQPLQERTLPAGGPAGPPSTGGASPPLHVLGAACVLVLAAVCVAKAFGASHRDQFAGPRKRPMTSLAGEPALLLDCGEPHASKRSRQRGSGGSGGATRGSYDSGAADGMWTQPHVFSTSAELHPSPPSPRQQPDWHAWLGGSTDDDEWGSNSSSSSSTQSLMPPLPSDDVSLSPSNTRADSCCQPLDNNKLCLGVGATGVEGAPNAAAPSSAPLAAAAAAVVVGVFRCGLPGCDYSTHVRRYLGEHVKTHTGYKPHACAHPGCGYRTSGAGHLKRHMRVHSKEKPFKCTVEGCDYATSQHTHLRVHTRVHTGEKPYACTIDGCGYRATRAWYVTRHMAKTHGIAQPASKRSRPAAAAVPATTAETTPWAQLDETMEAPPTTTALPGLHVLPHGGMPDAGGRASLSSAGGGAAGAGGGAVGVGSSLGSELLLGAELGSDLGEYCSADDWPWLKM